MIIYWEVDGIFVCKIRNGVLWFIFKIKNFSLIIIVWNF